MLRRIQPTIDLVSALRRPWYHAVVCVIGLGLLIRMLVSLHPYSGMHVPPTYGDYEAQRHWMEVTIHLPASEWYRNGPYNNLSHWGIDYPPLSGYQVRTWHAPRLSMVLSFYDKKPTEQNPMLIVYGVHVPL